MFPNDFNNSLFVAQRGNGQSDSFGYRVSAIKLSADGSNVIDQKVFADGWYDYDTQTIFGRPVDVTPLSDGSLLISDDGFGTNSGNGALYRVKYNGDLADTFFDSP